MSAEQLPLPLPHSVAEGWANFAVSSANAAAVAAVQAHQNWPQHRLILVGPPRSGKSHLARHWVLEQAGSIVEGPALRIDAVGDLGGQPLVVEDIDRLGPEAQVAMFHLLNLQADRRGALLMTSRTAPAQAGIGLRDLASRLSACALARIGPPDDTLLSSILVKHLADRGVSIAPHLVAKLVRGIERSYAAAETAARELDCMSMLNTGRIDTKTVGALLAATDGVDDTAGQRGD